MCGRDFAADSLYTYGDTGQCGSSGFVRSENNINVTLSVMNSSEPG